MIWLNKSSLFKCNILINPKSKIWAIIFPKLNCRSSIYFFFLYPFYIELLEAIVVKVYQAAEIEYVGLIKKKISMQRIISLTFLFTMDLSFFFTCIIGYQENTKRNENKIYFWVNRFFFFFFFYFSWSIFSTILPDEKLRCRGK